ncbi:serine hydrolase domain-containing protein [Paenibacillus alkalitolerans]|uniref:serine hydrolase domain-containing protein n=1 Tax=Paenibacillus alkalitolerans TaxID=2799335 RepID=UPI0018F5A8B5|nr:serine hydrolase [Paenibacillus alkalitolerans]
MTSRSALWDTVASPEEQEMDSSKLALVDRAIFSRYPNVLSMLIVRNNTIVYERYYRQIGPENAVPVMSVNKSVLSSLIGIALDKGILSSVDQVVADLFPELEIDTQGKRITLRHLLTMTSGLYYPRLAGDAQPIWQRTMRSNNWAEFSLRLPIKDVIGQSFNYKNTDAFLAAACLSRATGKSIGELANEWLFEPLKLTIPYWKADDPQELGIGSLSMTARDMARFGLLYLNGGIHGDDQIVPREWVMTSVKRQVGKNYGYLWWIEKDGFSASGAGGSLIRIIPSKQLVIVFQAKHLKRFIDPREIVERYLLSALIE